MFKFATFISGSGTWVAALIKKVERKDKRVGSIGIEQGVLYINVLKGEELTAKELMLLFSQVLQFNPEFLDKPFELRVVEEGQ